MTSRYYDRQGNPMTMEEWSRTYDKNRMAYKIVEQTDLPNGKWVSTVWLGLDHNFSGLGPPLIFETMAFPSHGDYQELDCERYSTEEEARLGHQRMVEKWSMTDDSATVA